jgi:hypothetical protein
MRYKIEYQSIWQLPQIFKTNSKKELNEIVLNGHQNQYIVLVNGKKKSSITYSIKQGGTNA